MARQRTILVLAVLMITASVASADVILELQPSSQSVTPGSPIMVDINIAGLGDPPSLGTFDINVAFDSTILSFDNFAFGDPVLGDQLDPTGGGNTIGFANSGTGTVELFEVSLDSDTTLNTLQPASFTLGVLTFDTIGVGTSPLTLSINVLGDADGNSLSASLRNGSVDVGAATAVPEPSSVLLLATGLLAISKRRRLQLP